MREIFRKVRAFYLRRKKLAVGVTVAILGIMAAVGVYAMIPEVRAEQGDSFADPILLTSGEHEILPGKYYKITGSGYTGSYILVYNGQKDDADAHILLENINWTFNSDESAIVFTSASDKIVVDSDIPNKKYTSKSGSWGNFEVTISGENRIANNYRGAQEPLISAENISYQVKTYGNEYDRINFNTNTNLMSSDVSRGCKVSFTGNGTVDDVLLLTTSINGTGAAIGSADVAKVKDKIVLAKDAGINASVAPSQSSITVNGITYPRNEEVLSGNLSYGSGKIEIRENANIIITGRGNGAGIGSGGSSVKTVSYDISTVKTETVSAATVMSGENNVTISGGSLSIHMADNALGCCIGTGAVAGERTNKGLVTIAGGNVDLVPSQKGYEFLRAYNSHNERVYKFILNIDEAMGDDNVFGGSGSTENYLLEDVEGETLKYAEWKGAANTDKNGFLNFQIDIAGDDTTTAYQYEFAGYAKAYFDNADNENMYFYLPTKVLNPHKLTVTHSNDSPNVSYEYKVANDSFASIGLNSPVDVKETKKVTIRLANVPSNCKTVSYRKSGDAAETNVLKNADGVYEFEFEMPKADCTITFAYEIERYDINYRYGAGISSSSIENPNPTKYPCGEAVTLQSPIWNQHSFAGWYEDAAFQNPVIEVISYSENDPRTVYGKWQCEVSFVDEDGTPLTSLVDSNGNPMDSSLKLDMNPDSGTIRLLTSDYPQSLESTDEKAFDGWELPDGTLLEPDEDGDYPERTFTENTTLKAHYHALGYYVYINSKYTPKEEGIAPVFRDIAALGNFEMYFQTADGSNQPI